MTKTRSNDPGAQELAGFHMLASLLGNDGDLDTLLKSSLQGILKFLRLPTGRISLREPGTDRFRSRAARGVPRPLGPVFKSFRMEEGPSGEAAWTGEPLLVPDLVAHKKKKGRLHGKLLPELLETGFRSLYAVPLFSKGEVIGLLDLLSRSPIAFTEADVHLIEFYGIHLARSIERARLLEEMERSERRYKEILETSKDLYFEIDLKGRFIHMSGAAHEVLGYAPEAMIGRSVDDFSDPDFVRMNRANFARVMTLPGFRVEVITRNREAGQVILELHGSRIMAGKKVVGVRGTARDVTAQKAAEAELADRYKELSIINAVTHSLSRARTKATRELSDTCSSSPVRKR